MSNSTRIGANTITYSTIETRDVLAGAYRAGRETATLLTHMVFLDSTGVEVRSGCRVSADRLVDTYGATDINSRPTCLTCAKRWDSLTQG